VVETEAAVATMVEAEGAMVEVVAATAAKLIGLRSKR